MKNEVVWMAPCTEEKRCLRCKVVDGADDAEGAGPKVHILSNGLCPRCDEVLYGKNHVWPYIYPIYIPTVPYIPSLPYYTEPTRYEWIITCQTKTAP